MTEKQAIGMFKERLEIPDYEKQIPEYYQAMKMAVEALEKQIQADALDIDMDKPMHFTDEQKAWIKNYIIINAKRQREDTIDECLRIITECQWKDADMLEDMIKELKHENTRDN